MCTRVLSYAHEILCSCLYRNRKRSANSDDNFTSSSPSFHHHYLYRSYSDPVLTTTMTNHRTSRSYSDSHTYSPPLPPTTNVSQLAIRDTDPPAYESDYVIF